MNLESLRKQYHQRICQKIIRFKKNQKGEEYPNFADGDTKSSWLIANGIVKRLNRPHHPGQIKGQTCGRLFEELTKDFLEAAFPMLNHLRPGPWHYAAQTAISDFNQYEHLADLKRLVNEISTLASTIGSDYIVTPDIVIARLPVSDEVINTNSLFLSKDSLVAKLTPLRSLNNKRQNPILHASISCKWTIRSDRSQNSRAEALNLVRNRKGHLPHIVVVTAEPMPTRIASLALGTGDIDCVYHFALFELQETVREINNEDQLEILDTLVNGRRLRDISDLPLDLAI